MKGDELALSFANAGLAGLGTAASANYLSIDLGFGGGWGGLSGSLRLRGQVADRKQRFLQQKLEELLKRIGGQRRRRSLG